MIEQYYSPSTGDTLTTHDAWPRVEEQMLWMDQHPDAVRLMKPTATKFEVTGEQRATIESMSAYQKATAEQLIVLSIMYSEGRIGPLELRARVHLGIVEYDRWRDAHIERLQGLYEELVCRIAGPIYIPIEEFKP